MARKMQDSEGEDEIREAFKGICLVLNLSKFFLFQTRCLLFSLRQGWQWNYFCCRTQACHDKPRRKAHWRRGWRGEYRLFKLNFHFSTLTPLYWTDDSWSRRWWRWSDSLRGVCQDDDGQVGKPSQASVTIPNISQILFQECWLWNGLARKLPPNKMRGK